MGRIWGFLFVAFGAVWCWDGWRLETTQRADSMFDELGPDRYLVVLGAIMLAVGASLLLRPPPTPVHAGTVGGASFWWPPRPPVTFTLAMAGYTFAIPLIGYTIATFLFFLVIYPLAGQRSARSVFIYGAVTAAAFYVIFDRLSDMALPAGPFGF